MPFKLQLSDAKQAEEILDAASSCTDSARFLSLVNRAQRRLWKRGNWWNSEWLVGLCVYGPCITWPHYVGTVLGIRFGCGAGLPITNNWSAIIGPKPYTCCSSYTGIGMRDANTSPLFNEISGCTGNRIVYRVVKAQDVGKTATLYGKQNGGQPLMHKNDTVWEPGVIIQATSPASHTAMDVTQIDSVVREATQGMAYLLEYNATTGAYRNLAEFQPNDTNPQFRRSYVDTCSGFMNCACVDDYGIKRKSVEALVKLEFIPVKNDYDFLMVDDLDALAMMISAIRDEDAGNQDAAEVNISKAIRELNFGLRDKSPGNQLTVSINAIGKTITNAI
jgi:hypothetical protein